MSAAAISGLYAAIGKERCAARLVWARRFLDLEPQFVCECRRRDLLERVGMSTDLRGREWDDLPQSVREKIKGVV